MGYDVVYISGQVVPEVCTFSPMAAFPTNQSSVGSPRLVQRRGSRSQLVESKDRLAAGTEYEVGRQLAARS